ncbi:MAG: hypothetical protein JW795_10230 [Chitinivibrionales bacterium]|nr:hypothetical protein [Chitinivibrionales bacterium]
MQMPFAPRRGEYRDSNDLLGNSQYSLQKPQVHHLETFDSLYRSLCAILYNYAPTSGHPGGSISSGRIVQSLLFNLCDYDLSNPQRKDADCICYGAGHKALGLYSLWALRNEIARIGANDLLPKEIKNQLRLEDLLGFRRNSTIGTPLFKKFDVKPLDGHPTPVTPMIRLSTGASGVGVAASIGLAFAAYDYYGTQAPHIHIIEGEGGLTPGRVSESLSAAATAGLKNVILHVDWNQASIDSDRVCRENGGAGDYVQWNPVEFIHLHDWNVIFVDDGKDFYKINAAQKQALSFANSQPTAIVYRTTKGWGYGIEGKKSHGAGHQLCSSGFVEAVKPLLSATGESLSLCSSADAKRCNNGTNLEIIEHCLWDALGLVRRVLESDRALVQALAEQLRQARERLLKLNRLPRVNGPDVEKSYAAVSLQESAIPTELQLKTGSSTTLRGELGKALNYLNKKSSGAFLVAAADLLGSTNANMVGSGFGDGFFNTQTNGASRTLSIGGICEDAIAGIMSGVSAFGTHIGVGSSYAAFIASLGHIASRLHAIANQSRQSHLGGQYYPLIIICGHSGINTGEDGPTHADPQPLQLLQENFPHGTAISLTPWDPQEVWPLLKAALAKRPALIYPFVTRPNEKVLDRKELGLCPVQDCTTGVYCLRKAATSSPHGVLVLQGSEVASVFCQQTLPLLLKDSIDCTVYYVASAELFDYLTPRQQEKIFPQKDSQIAMGISGFTLPTLYRWVSSNNGRHASLYPFKKGHYLGSGRADTVMAEAGLDCRSQFDAISAYVKDLNELLP